MADQSGNSTQDGPGGTRSGNDDGALRVVGLLLFLLPIALFTALILVWPIGKVGEDGKITTLLSGPENRQYLEISLFLIVLVSGALGSAIFAARSFAGHMARGDFGMNWLWWYAIRIPVGMGLALIVYVVLRGGLFAGSFADSTQALSTVNPFGFAALATLSGMFARQAADKLEEIFSGIFSTQEKPPTDPQPAVPAPNVASFAGKSLLAGASAASDLRLKVTGTNFTAKSLVFANGNKRPTAVVSATELSATLDKKDVAAPGKLSIMVVNPKSAGGASAAQVIEIK